MAFFTSENEAFFFVFFSCKGANTTIAQRIHSPNRCCDKIEVFQVISSIRFANHPISSNTLLWLCDAILLLFSCHILFSSFSSKHIARSFSPYLLGSLVCVCFRLDDRMSSLPLNETNRMAIRKIIVWFVVVWHWEWFGLMQQCCSSSVSKPLQNFVVIMKHFEFISSYGLSVFIEYDSV